MCSSDLAGAAAAPGRYALGDLRIERGADGIVRLYAVAREDGTSEDVAGGLVYDTTTTRAQFTFDWEAVGDASTQQGVLILQARKAGPVMNRAELAIANAPKGLTLTVTHPHRPDFKETWDNLPQKLEDLIAVLNGRASADPRDDAVQSGDIPFYAYATDGPRTGRNEAYASELVQAAALDTPNNGADALVQPGTAQFRQQGNFTGWTRAPLAVSGRFGDNGFGPVVATVDLIKDRLERLRVPGDFAVESWVRPGSLEAAQRVFNWHQLDGDGFSVSLDPEPAFAFPVDTELLHVTLAETTTERWFGEFTEEEAGQSEFKGCNIQVGFHVPHSGGEGAEASLLTHTTIQNNARPDLEKLFTELHQLRQDQVSAFTDADKRKKAQEQLDDWWEAVAKSDNTDRYWGLDDHIAVEVNVDLHVTLEGPLARLSISYSVLAKINLPEDPDNEDQEFWTEPITGKKKTKAETRRYIETKLVPLWTNFTEGRQVKPPETTWKLRDESRKEHRLSADRITLAEGTLTAQEGSWVEVDLTLVPNDGVPLITKSSALHFHSGSARVHVDGKLAGELSSDTVWIGPPIDPSNTQVTLGARRSEEHTSELQSH